MKNQKNSSSSVSYRITPKYSNSPKMDPRAKLPAIDTPKVLSPVFQVLTETEN